MWDESFILSVDSNPGYVTCRLDTYQVKGWKYT